MRTPRSSKRSGLIVIGFIVVALLSFSAYIISRNTINDNATRLTNNVTLSNQIQGQLLSMSEALHNRMLLTYDILYEPDAFKIDEKVQAYRIVGGEFIQARETLLLLQVSEKLKNDIDALKKVLTASGVILNKIVEQRLEGISIGSFEEISRAREVNISINQSIAQLINEQAERALTSLQLTKQQNQAAEQKVIILNILALLIAIAVIAYILLQLKAQGEKLDEAMFALEDSNHSLEQRVEKRTHELLQVQNENQRISAEVQVSKELQEVILPTVAELKKIKSLDIATYMKPAEEVGGDYFDVIQHDDELLISIGDVTGHGLESGMIMLMTQSLVRHEYLKGLTSLSDTLVAVNKTLYQNIHRINSERNLTLSLIQYYAAENAAGLLEGSFKITGQHEEVIVIRNNGDLEIIDTVDLGMPIGLINDVSDFTNESTHKIKTGDVLILFTDGITEAINPEEAFYGLERLCRLGQEHRKEAASRIRDIILDDLNDFVSTQTWFDDVSLIILKQA